MSDQRAPCLADLRYLGTVQGFTRGQWGFGDIHLGRGIGIRYLENGDFGTIRLYLATTGPLQILQADVNIDFTGTLRAGRAIGTLPCHWSMPWGVFYDRIDDAVYLTCHNDYDGDPAINPTLSRGIFGADGNLIPDGQWAFANRSDKMTDGGICELPDGRLGAGFGGYRSVVATGPASMGAALTAFDRPRASGPIPNTPLLSYPFNEQPAPRMTRPPNYINDIGGDANYPTPAPGEPGLTTWCDWMPQCGVWIETASISGLLLIVQRATGRCWYTNTLNAEGAQYDLISYGRAVLEGGGAEDSYQPEVDEPFIAPGLPATNVQWADSPPNRIAGVAYEPVSQILCVGIQNVYGTDAATYATGYFFFQVLDDATPPEPAPSGQYRVTRTTVETQDVEATSEADAIDVAENHPDDWTAGEPVWIVRPIPPTQE